MTYTAKPHTLATQSREHFACVCGWRTDKVKSSDKAEGYMGMTRRWNDHLRQMSEGMETRNGHGSG